MKRGSIFETDGIPRMSEALPLAMQHVVAMIVGCRSEEHTSELQSR